MARLRRMLAPLVPYDSVAWPQREQVTHSRHGVDVIALQLDLIDLAVDTRHLPPARTAVTPFVVVAVVVGPPGTFRRLSHPWHGVPPFN
jgi:hypothetical protein